MKLFKEHTNICRPTKISQCHNETEF